ncbi:MAG: zinc ribbon domain-containing protein, partial [Desulfobacterales bacterium]|nr:zinc ribbon domain-containing protein [Desulfobacterales bacterium]
MPLFDFLCLDCGKSSEILTTDSEDKPKCQSCGSYNLKKLLAAHSSFSGA